MGRGGEGLPLGDSETRARSGCTDSKPIMRRTNFTIAVLFVTHCCWGQGSENLVRVVGERPWLVRWRCFYRGLGRDCHISPSRAQLGSLGNSYVIQLNPRPLSSLINAATLHPYYSPLALIDLPSPEPVA